MSVPRARNGTAYTSFSVLVAKSRRPQRSSPVPLERSEGHFPRRSLWFVPGTGTWTVSSPSPHPRPIPRPLPPHERCEVTGLGLYDRAELVAFAFIWLFTVQALETLFGQQLARRIIQAARFVDFQVDASAEQRQDGAVNDQLAELLDQVQGETRLARAIDVEKATIRVETSQDDRPLDLTIQHTVAVIQETVHQVGRALVLAARPACLGRDDDLQRLPVTLGGSALQPHQRAPNSVQLVAAQ